MFNHIKMLLKNCDSCKINGQLNYLRLIPEKIITDKERAR